MTDTVDKLLGLADRFAILYSDAREARALELPGGVWVDDAKQAKADLEAALREALDWGEPVAWLLEPKVQRNPDRHMIRGCYVGARTQQDFEFAELDGDKYTPLYAKA